MKKALLALSSIASIVFVACWEDNDSSERDWSRAEIRISNSIMLQEFRDSVNAGRDFSGQTITLTNNISLVGSQQNQWTPIGETQDLAFRGVFNGNGRTISGVFINRPNSDNIGFFGFLRGEVRNLGLRDVNIRGRENVGSLVGTKIAGDISEVFVNLGRDGRIQGETNVGGLIGISDNSIVRNSFIVADEHTTDNIVGNTTTVGGLVGNNGSTIEFSYVFADVVGGTVVGGLSGFNRRIIRNSYFSGTRRGLGDRVGDLVGDRDTAATIDGNSRRITPAEMRVQGTFVGWDFDNVWEFSSWHNNNSSPWLRRFW